MKKEVKIYNQKIAKFVGASMQQSKTCNTFKWVFNSDKPSPLRTKFDGRLVLQDLHFNDDLNWAIEVLRLIEYRGCIIEVILNLGFTSCRICIVGNKHDKVINIMHDNNDSEDEAIDIIYNAICDYIDFFENKTSTKLDLIK
jgi:hypothetical protein